MTVFYKYLWNNLSILRLILKPFLFTFQSIRLLQWNLEMPDYAYHLLLGLYLPIVILGSLLNIFMLIIILSTPKLRLDPRVSFILTLAISDFFLCNFTSPLTLWSTLEGHWPFGYDTRILCQFVKAGKAESYFWHNQHQWWQRVINQSYLTDYTLSPLTLSMTFKNTYIKIVLYILIYLRSVFDIQQ